MTDKTTPEHHAEAILRAAGMSRFSARVLATHPRVLSAVREAMEAKWLPIESAPDVPGKYFFCRLAWGPDSDKCTGDGFRWNGQWFAAALFYKGARHDECQNEMRQIKVTPTHWMPHCDFPLPTPPRGEALAELIAITADQYGDTER